ncbi:hypothetical protein QN347_05610 [Sphingomonas sp. 10B4]|nr:hypothetical protein [Sphingomonas sp. 10B4]
MLDCRLRGADAQASGHEETARRVEAFGQLPAFVRHRDATRPSPAQKI